MTSKLDRKDLKDILSRVVQRLKKEQAPQQGCMFGDGGCDVTTLYAVGEEGGAWTALS